MLRQLQDKFKISSRQVQGKFKAISRYVHDKFMKSSRQFLDKFQTSSKQFQNKFKKSSKQFQEKFNTISRQFPDKFKKSSTQVPGKFKTSSSARSRPVQDKCKTSMIGMGSGICRQVDDKYIKRRVAEFVYGSSQVQGEVGKRQTKFKTSSGQFQDLFKTRKRQV
jgi:hypothetical protein